MLSARSSRKENWGALLPEVLRSRSSALIFLSCITFSLGLSKAAGAAELQSGSAPSSEEPEPWFNARLQTFFVKKARQAHQLADLEKKSIDPHIWEYFDAGIKGDWVTAGNLYRATRARSYQSGKRDESLETMAWQPMDETFLAYLQFAHLQQKNLLAFAQGTINSIPPGAIYFGGTDAGRAVITAMSDSQIDGNPFFTVSPNAFADHLYLNYLRAMYGSKIFTPTHEDSKRCFEEYVADAQQRLKENRLRSGEDVKMVDGKAQIRGQVAVMAVSALLARMIFDKNPNRELYVEESFPLDWMFPYLSPSSMIMKINREPLTELREELLRQDHDYWIRSFQPMIGDWLDDSTTLETVATFVEQVYLKHEFANFRSDRLFTKDKWSQKLFSKLRASIGGIYAWRVGALKDVPTPQKYLAKTPAEQQRMTREADFAFRQAWALSPDSPQTVFRYAHFLEITKRIPEAIRIANTAARFPPNQEGSGPTSRDVASYRELVKRLKEREN